MIPDFPALPTDYETRMPHYEDAVVLSAIIGFGGRQIFLAPEATEAWLRLAAAAEQAGAPLLLLSGFRSVARQTEIVRDKLKRGEAWPEILRLSAYPGFSEHHTGRAIDVGALGYEALTTAFDGSPQFRWLMAHAKAFGFVLSYPKNNASGIAYEPWHWCWRG